MQNLVRFGVSFDKDLFDNFENMIREEKCTNRSEVIRDLVRQKLMDRGGEENNHMTGVITFIYDHHKKSLLTKIADTRHCYEDIIQSLQHIYLNHRKCLEIVTVKGYPAAINELADTIRALKDVDFCLLSMPGNGKK